MSDRDNTILTDATLSDQEHHMLEILMGMMIPASQEFGIPGADDAQIFANIISKTVPYHALIAEELGGLNKLSESRCGDVFSDIDSDQRSALMQEFDRSNSLLSRVLLSIAVQCYYQDDRILESLGIEARSPYPAGYEVEQGDWSLLDPVRQREKLYREIDS